MVEVRIRQDEGLDPKLPMLWDTVWNVNGYGDWAMADPEVELDNIGGLKAQDPLSTAILICLFTDRRRPDSIESIDDSGERRGWHGDTYDVVTEDHECPLGSLLWTLGRAALTEETVRMAKYYTEECLQTLVDQGVVHHFEIDAERVETANRLSISVKAYDAVGEATYQQNFTLE